MLRRDSIAGTLTVALVLCVVCSVVVSGAAVGLRSLQEANKEQERHRNILAAAGLLQEGADVGKLYEERVVPRLYDLKDSKFVDASAEEIAEFNPLAAAESPATSIDLKGDDPAGIGRRENETIVYLIRDEQGRLSKVVLPVRGKGLWSTMYGFLAVESDGETIAGLTFYEQGETPGLGGEVENQRWKEQWPGKPIYNADGSLSIEVVKGAAPDPETQVDGLSGATITTRGVNNLVHFWLGERGFAGLLNQLKQGDVSVPSAA